MPNFVPYATQTLEVVPVYISTSGVVLQRGQILCTQEDPASFSGQDQGYNVEIPNTNNELYFVGIIDPAECLKPVAERTTPGIFNMIRPRRGNILYVLCSNVTQFAIGDVLALDYNTPTATAAVATAGGGALQKLTLNPGTVNATAVQSAIIDAASVQILDATRRRLALALSSLASASAAGVRARSLAYVSFL